MNSSIEVFDPFATFSAGTESESGEVLPVKMAYNFEENVRRQLTDRGSILAPYEHSDDEDDELFQECMDVAALYPSPQELDAYISKFKHDNYVSQEDVLAIETKYPGLLTNYDIEFDSEALSYSTESVVPALENSAVGAGVAAIVLVVGLIIKMVWSIGKGPSKYADQIEQIRNGSQSVDKAIENLSIKYNSVYQQGLKNKEIVTKSGKSSKGLTLETLVKAVGGQLDFGKAISAVNKGPAGKIKNMPILSDPDKFKKFMLGADNAFEKYGKEVVEFINDVNKLFVSSSFKNLISKEQRTNTKSEDGVNDPISNMSASKTNDIIKQLPKPPNNFIKTLAGYINANCSETSINNISMLMLEQGDYKELKESLTSKTGDMKMDRRVLTQSATDAIELSIKLQKNVGAMSKTFNIDEIKKSLSETLKMLKERAKESVNEGVNRMNSARGKDNPKSISEGEGNESRRSPLHVSLESGAVQGDSSVSILVNALKPINEQLSFIHVNSKLLADGILSFYSDLYNLLDSFEDTASDKDTKDTKTIGKSENSDEN